MKRRHHSLLGLVVVAVPVIGGGVFAVAPAASAAATVTGTVYTKGSVLNVRAGATTASAVRATLRDGSKLTIVCQQPGQQIRGDVRTTTMWNRLSNGTYASDAYVKRSTTPPRCAQSGGGGAGSANTAGTVYTRGAVLNLRAGATTASAVRGTVRDGSKLTIVCQQPGQQIRGDVRTTTMWNRLSNGTYASDAYVKRSTTPPRCAQPGSTTPATTPASGGGSANVAGTVYARGAVLNVRAGATTASAVRGTLRDGSRITIACQDPGQNVRGDVRTTNMWNRMTNGNYVSDAYVKRSATPQRCTQPVAAPKPSPSTTMIARVDSGGVALNVRVGPTTNAPVSGTLRDGSTITIACQVSGKEISGEVRKTKMWNRLTNGQYVSDAFVIRGSTPPSCPPLPESLRGWVAPVDAPGGSAYRTKERPTHDGIDFATYRNTPIVAAAAGRVTVVVCNSSTGNCDVDGSPKVYGCGWYVEIQHAGNIVTRYCHMVRRPPVKVGQWVSAGQLIGNVGSSGNSSGPHLHFEVHTNAPPATRSNAVDPRSFMAQRGVYF